jgi:choline dehydrogenase
LTVSRITKPTALTETFIAAGESIGVARNDDFAGAGTLGIGLCDLTVRNGRRCSAAVAFLRPAMNRPNLTVVTRATARKLTIRNGRYVGVEYSEGGRLERAEATSEVILSAGAFGSPKLLMLSGIGHAGDLGKFWHQGRVDLPGVVRNLQDHLLTFIIHEGKKPLPMSAYNVLDAHFFAKSDSRRIGPDHQPFLMCGAPPLPYLDIPPNSYAIAPGIIRPASTGEVRLTGIDPDAALYVDPGYLREEADVRCLVQSLEMSLEVANATPFYDWRKAQIYPRKTDRASLTRYVREVSETYHHHAGTCKMGIDATSVVDPELSMHGIDGPRVADASIMPAVVSGNTNAPSIMIGEKAADLIRAGKSVARERTAA